MKAVFVVQLYCHPCPRMACRDNIELEIGEWRGFACTKCNGTTEVRVPNVPVGTYCPFIGGITPIAIGFTRKS